MNTNNQTVLIVDDAVENIEILSYILKDSYNILVAKCGEVTIKVAEKYIPDIILLDIMLPDFDGFEVCRQLKQNPITKSIPIIFITSRSDDIDEAKGFEIGAVDYITKPVRAPVVLARLKTHLALYDQNRYLEELINVKTKELTETRLQVIRKLSLAAEYKDCETNMHIIRVSYYCKLIALKYGFSRNEADLIFNASSMHDVGKIGIPDSILQKKGKLDTSEFKIVKQHCIIGADLIGDCNYDLLKIAKTIALEHHEKWDGSGYPYGIKGEEISTYARITSVADVFDALTSKRPYKDPWPIEKAVHTIEKHAGNHFEPKVVDAFLDSLNDILEIKNGKVEK